MSKFIRFYSENPNPRNPHGVKPNSYGETIMDSIRKYTHQKTEVTEMELFDVVQSKYHLSKPAIRVTLQRLISRGIVDVREERHEENKKLSKREKLRLAFKKIFERDYQ